MKNKSSHFSKLFTVLILAIILSFFGVLLIVKKTNATDDGSCTGYFRQSNDCSGGHQVVAGGIPSDIKSKSDFISWVKDLESSSNEHKHVGGSYFIQTMRGANVNGNWDHDFPSAADINNWEDSVNNPLVDVDWNQSYDFGRNTMVTTNYKDVVSYTDNDTASAVVFSVGGKVKYAIKKSCGNPLDSLNGLPQFNKDYTLVPVVSLSSNVIEPGSKEVVTSKIQNKGRVSSSVNTDSDPADWDLTETVTPTQTPNPSNPLDKDTNQVFLAAKTKQVSSLTTSNTNYTVGTKLCFTLSVKPTSDNDNSSTSDTKCAFIGKRPKTQVWGGDLMVGGAVTTSSSQIGNNTFGSWAEYAIFAKGVISSSTSGKIMASGSAFAGGGQANSTTALASKLSFANSGNKLNCTGAADPNAIGCYTIPAALDIAASFSGGVAVPDATGIPNNWPSDTYFVAGNITLNSSTLVPGKSVIIKATNAAHTGTVTIAGDQKYNDGPYTNIKDLPQLVIIADNINIADNVTQIDAWLIANGNLNTCSSVAGTSLSVSASLSSGMCASQLTVTGPVEANKIYLRRTAGSDNKATVGSYAEKFNLRADAYLWAYNRVSGNGRIQTIHTTELPPRL